MAGSERRGHRRRSAGQQLRHHERSRAEGETGRDRRRPGFQATVEKKIRAYDKDTGKVLWTDPLPDGSEGSPAIYEVDGRQYVAVCVRGSYVAFALPAGSQ